jgi:hypothetical protein
MASSVGEQIMVAMVQALNLPSPKPCMCYRDRIDAFSDAELPAFVLYATEEQGVIKGPNTMLRTRTIRLEILVQGRAPADALIDPLYVYAVQTLQADPTVYPLIRKMHDATIQWETEASRDDVAVAMVHFDVVYVTQLTDPTVLVTT